MASLLLKVLFPPPPNLFVTAMSVVSLVSLTNAGLEEIRGRHMQYAKFWSDNSIKTKLSGRNGMVIAYTPAFLAAAASFCAVPDEGFRIFLVKSALTVHFFKRIFEVLFIHKFSGYVAVESAIPITLSYCLSTATMIYCQHLTQGLAEPSLDLKYVGIVLFLLGITGNFYHHYILSKLRSKNDREYKVPKGGLFNIVICPHYLFEILGFWGVFFISQTLYAFCFATGTTFYLMGRSYVTRKWYLSKFEDFPKDVKALIPFVF